MSDNPQLLQTLLEQAAGRVDFPLQDWWQRSLWEPTVALAIRDHVRPGDIAYDVGANAGGLSQQMSRQVGPRGIVCAFEASPRIVARTQHNLVRAGCFNVTLYHRAVWHTSGEIVNIAAGVHLNDRIDPDMAGVPVATLALDDFAAATGLPPSFIKMDIEGAEFDALKGMGRLLRDRRPVLVLEQTPEDMRCHSLLQQTGYAAVDLASYRRIESALDFDRATGVVNVLFIPRERMTQSPYFGGGPEKLMEIEGSRFARSEGGDISLPDPPLLPPGRYMLHARFSASGTDNEVFAGVQANGEDILRMHTHTEFLAGSYHTWPIQLDRPAHVAPYLRYLRGRDDSLVWDGVDIMHLPAFETFPGPLIT